MPRSAVRTGRIDARDRATRRRRDRSARPHGASDPRQQLARWIEGRLSPLSDSALAGLDLEALLRETWSVQLPNAERLRRVAIWLERHPSFAHDRRSWAGLHRVYLRALREAPDEPWIHASLGISASEVAERVHRRTPALARRLHAIAHGALARACRLDAHDAQIANAQGQCLYADPDRDVTEALDAFERAVGIDPAHGWARLYLAHCLHDLRRWSEAAAAYDAVGGAAFSGPSSWRLHLRVEQRGLCRLRAGDVPGAFDDLRCILARYEAQPHLARWGRLAYLRQAADEAFPSLRPRIDALARHL